MLQAIAFVAVVAWLLGKLLSAAKSAVKQALEVERQPR